MTTSVIIALGSNLDDPEAQVRRAIVALSALPNSQMLAASSLYSSHPQGPQDQNDFVNAVAKIETSLDPVALLKQLKDLEQSFGRIKTRHWGERIIDLDIIFYGRQVLQSDSPDLTIPHPRALERDFVLKPLLEIQPDFRHPNGTPLTVYLDRCEDFCLKVIQSR